MLGKTISKIFILILFLLCFTNILSVEAVTTKAGVCNGSYGKKLISYSDFNNYWVSGKGYNFCISGNIYSMVPNCVSYTNSIKCTYVCMGTSNSTCTFYVKKENTCGSATGKSYSSAPKDNLCTPSATTSTVEDRSSSWAWTCRAYGGALVSYCSASKSCFKSGEYVSGSEQCCNGLVLCPISSGLYLGQCSEKCSADCEYTYEPACGNDGKDYNNECLAQKFGNGVAYRGECKYHGAKCGVASEVTGYSLEDRNNLCSVGNPSIVSGAGPWYWICKSETSNWGTSCFAVKKGAINGSCGLNNGKSFKAKPTSNLCLSGAASQITAGNAWYWTCDGINGGEKAYCYAIREGYTANGTCDTSTFFNYKPNINVCLSGAVSELRIENGVWTWNCKGINGGIDRVCNASYTFYPLAEKYETGSCGAASGIAVAYEPVKNFCNLGYFKDFRWDENAKEWKWTCAGRGGAPSENCGSYYSTSLIRANGQCGSSSGSTFETAPTTNLCTVGVASTVSGKGPWGWTCSGISGGSKATCNAKKASKVNGACGSSASLKLKVAPIENLCSAGTSSAVSGTGPWYWTCFGALGGKDIQCTGSTSSTLLPQSSPENYILLETMVSESGSNGIKVSLKDYGIRVFMNKGKAPYLLGTTPDNPKDTEYARATPSSGWADAIFFTLPEETKNTETFCFDAWYKAEWENGKISGASQFYSDCISLAPEYPNAPTDLEVKLYSVNGGAIALPSWEDYKNEKGYDNRYSTVVIRTKGISPYYPDEASTSAEPVIGSDCKASNRGCPSYDIVANGDKRVIASYLTKGNYCYAAWTRYCNGYYCYNTKKPAYWCFEIK